MEINPYLLIVEKKSDFSWEEIEPQIIESLKKAIGEAGQEIEVIPYPRPISPLPSPEVFLEPRTKKSWLSRIFKRTK